MPEQNTLAAREALKGFSHFIEDGRGLLRILDAFRFSTLLIKEEERVVTPSFSVGQRSYTTEPLNVRVVHLAERVWNLESILLDSQIKRLNALLAPISSFEPRRETEKNVGDGGDPKETFYPDHWQKNVAIIRTVFHNNPLRIVTITPDMIYLQSSAEVIETTKTTTHLYSRTPSLKSKEAIRNVMMYRDGDSKTTATSSRRVEGVELKAGCSIRNTSVAEVETIPPLPETIPSLEHYFLATGGTVIGDSFSFGEVGLYRGGESVLNDKEQKWYWVRLYEPLIKRLRAREIQKLVAV